MPTVIITKNSSTASAVPLSADLVQGELAVNVTDKKLYTKNASGTVVELVGSNDKIQSITASVASNALTVTLNPTTLDFRSSTLGSGTVSTRTIGTAISAVVPSGATLGTTNATLSKVMLLAIDNAGTVELAVCNSSLSLDESTLISTTLLDSASDSASVIYSTTARTNVPFRIVGYVESTQATAGTWATSPSKIQGIGGQIRSGDTSGGGFGYGQSWQSVSRVSGTTYYNTTSKPIMVSAWCNNSSANASIYITVNGVQMSNSNINNAGSTTLVTAVVPIGHSYVITANASMTVTELS